MKRPQTYFFTLPGTIFKYFQGFSTKVEYGSHTTVSRKVFSPFLFTSCSFYSNETSLQLPSLPFTVHGTFFLGRFSDYTCKTVSPTAKPPALCSLQATCTLSV